MPIDLLEDPAEGIDVSDRFPEVVEELDGRLDEFCHQQDGWVGAVT